MYKYKNRRERESAERIEKRTVEDITQTDSHTVREIENDWEGLE